MINGTYEFLAVFQLAARVVGKIVFLNYFANLFTFRSLENLPNQAGN
jgi:hypothetical protein